MKKTIKNKKRFTIKMIEKSAVTAIVLMLAFNVVPVTQAQIAQAQTLMKPIDVFKPFDFENEIIVMNVVEPEPTVQEALLAVCESEGYGEDCAKTLLGMLWTESSNRSDVIGDSGRARGYFQIHYRLHNISAECAEDIVCASQWTIKYLERNSYPKYVDYAIQCHNSCNAGNGYVGKVKRYGAYFWDTPLEITQTAPVVLPVKEATIEVASVR